jgi:hypothetical protein
MSSRPRARREMGVRHRWSGEPLLVTQSHFPSNAPRCRPSLLRAQIPVIGRGRAEWVKSTRGGASPPQCERITRSPRRRAATTAKLHVVPLVGAGGNYDLAVVALSMPFDNHCLTLAICFSAAQLQESRQTPVYARCRDCGRGEGPKAPRNVPPAHQTHGPALCRARTNSREDTRGRVLREPRLAKATCCWRDRQPCYPSHVARATGMRGDPRVHCNPARACADANALAI